MGECPAPFLLTVDNIGWCCELGVQVPIHGCDVRGPASMETLRSMKTEKFRFVITFTKKATVYSVFSFLAELLIKPWILFEKLFQVKWLNNKKITYKRWKSALYYHLRPIVFCFNRQAVYPKPTLSLHVAVIRGARWDLYFTKKCPQGVTIPGNC